MLQFVEAALDAITLTVERLVMGNSLFATADGRDHRLHVGRFDSAADGIAIIGSVADDGLALNAVQHRLGHPAFMHLAAGQTDPQRPAEGISQQMDLGGQSSSGTPQSLVRSPFLAAPLPVAACWWALTRVASSIRYSFFGSSMRAANTRSQTPDFAHRVKRLWTLLYLPYRSGNSSHCAPDRKTQRTPLTNRRLSFAVRPGSDFLPGNISAIRAHCCSLSSYRFAMRCAPNRLTRNAVNQNRFPMGILNVDWT